MDAFLVAFRIPNLVRDLFAGGAISAAFVPTFTRHLLQRGKDDAWHLANDVLNAALAAAGLIVVLGIIFAHPLVVAFAGDFARVPGKLDLTVTLARLMLPFLVLVTAAAVVMAMLNSLGHFFLPALSPAMFNVATIASAILLVPAMPRFGLPRILAIAIGALVGGAGQLVVQWPALKKEGFRYRLSFDARDSGLREVLILMGPGTIGLAAVQANVLVNTIIATTQGTGAVSWLNYAFRLMYLPIGLVGVSIATAVLPAVSRQAAATDYDAVRATVARGLGVMLLLNFPATFGLIALATPIVRLLFQHGRFTAVDTQATAAAVQLYAVGLVGYSAARIVSPTFYALGRSHVPVAASVAAIAVNIALSVGLVGSLGFRGLALATSVAALVNGGTLVWQLRSSIGGIDGRRIARDTVKTTIAAVVMTAAALASDRYLPLLIPGAHVGSEALRLGVTLTAAVLVLIASAKVLRIPELDDLVEVVSTRLQ